jgi:hypothetical protein
MRFVPSNDTVSYLRRIGVPAFQGTSAPAVTPRKKPTRAKSTRPGVSRKPLPRLVLKPLTEPPRPRFFGWLNRGLKNIALHIDNLLS